MNMGYSFTGVVRGVRVLELKKKDGGTFLKRIFVCEGNECKNEEFSLTDEQANMGWVDKLNALRDKVVTFNCAIRVNGQFVNYSMGDNFPVEVKKPAASAA